MTKRILITLVGLALVLAACQGASQPVQSTVQGTAVAQESPAPVQDTPSQAIPPTVAPETSQPAVTEAAGPSVPPGCTVVSPQPTPGPTEQSLFPAVSESDWVQGSETAYVTIIEYGDFQ